MNSIGDMIRINNLGFRFSDDVKSYLDNFVKVMGALPERKYQQVLWILDLNKWYDMVVHPLPGQVQPAIECIESGKAAWRFSEHVTELVGWMAKYDQEDTGSPTPMTRDAVLDRIDATDRWMKSRGVNGIYKPVREMLADCKKYMAAASEVAKRMS